MKSSVLRSLLNLGPEEKILNVSTLVAIVCVFFPWVGGEWLGGEIVSYSGLQFYTSVIGLVVLLLYVFVLLITLVPLTGGPELVRVRQKHVVRLIASFAGVILTLAIWSVLTKFTFDFSRIEVHFGLYGTLIGGLVASLYSYLRYREQQRAGAREFFSYPEKEEDSLPTEGSVTDEPSEPEDLNHVGSLFDR